MKRCNQCGKIVEDDVNYCPNCGLPYFSSCDTDQGTHSHEKNNPKNKEHHDNTESKRRIIRSIIIGFTVSAAVIISIVVLAFLSDTGEFVFPARNESVETDALDAVNQETSNEDDANFDTKEASIDEPSTEEQSANAVMETETSEEEAAAANEPLTVIEVDIPEDGVEVTDENRNEVALSRLMSVDSDEFQYLELGEPYGYNGVYCIEELPDDNIRMYCYYDDEVWFSGVAFDIKGEICYFDWCYASVNYYPVSMYWNEDDQQLQVTCTPNHGTGFYAPDLYIVQKNDSGEWVSFHYGYEDYSQALQERMSYELDEETRTITLFDNETGYEVISYEVPEYNMPYLKGVAWGEYSDFELGDQIVYIMDPGYVDDWWINCYPEADALWFELILNLSDDGQLTFELGRIGIIAENGSVTMLDDQSLQSVEYEIQKMDSSVYDGDRLLVEVSYDLVVLSGVQNAVKKINSSLYAEYEAFLTGSGSAEMANSLAKELINTESEYQESYISVIEANISYNADGLLSISYTQEWFIGGAFNFIFYGQIYDLSTGEIVEMKELSGMDEETFLSTLKQTLLTYIAEKPDDWFFENAVETVENYTLDNFTLDLRDGKIVIIVNEYELGPLSTGWMIVPTGIEISR